MSLLSRKYNSRQTNEQNWHASFASFQNSLTASCAHIRTTSITWNSRTAQSRFIPVHTGYHSRNGMHSNTSLITWSRLASWNAVVLRNGPLVPSSSQEGWQCSMDIRLPCSQQMHQMENLSIATHF